ncbi:HEAT repeat domain-containing protein [Nostoc sp. UHCC 0870]|uniref:HEAT repeat domain-containing protein n=1 Tax=Nostoc sp. UHCC 0870 TaxID=2914041 RepID=UPI001EDE6F7A|nr:HEAT repeat domain-containing protein [Nostoc sp. UHCC 0870]UKO97104.1 HEAT repeat domain-containing protein [Nostoc sp. UHCC 0870]
MLERLVAWGVKNAFGLAFKTVLEQLAQQTSVASIKDFFSIPLRGIVSSLGINQQETLEVLFGQALKEFLSQVQLQLEDADLSEADIKQYTQPLKIFLTQSRVQAELGKALIADILPDAEALSSMWMELNLPPLPDDFNWRSLIKRYTRKINVILGESPELSAILDRQNLLEIQQTNKAFADTLSNFDLLRYRAEIQKNYAHLRLDSFDTSGYSYNLKLWNIFVAQNVREVNEAAPKIYELPKEHLQRLKKLGQLEEDFDINSEVLEQYQKNYTQQVSCSVLEIINDSQTYKYIVILGDPGSGKSSLLQYLTLQWAEKPIENFPLLPIPLLVELRTYVRYQENEQCQDFLEFFRKNSGLNSALNHSQLDAVLRNGDAYVMFDGLDEVFEPSKREAAITDIINFTQDYPLVRVIVTSRVIGYQPNRLRDASFRHFMLQDLELEQIYEFISLWHNLAFSDLFEKQRKQARLEKAIQDFQPIRQLAGNPLLLTMMAILNRNQELPRDRAELYNQASRVLLQQWDLEKLLLSLETSTIDYKDKQAMLRQVAYSMQTTQQGLAGNLINASDLEEILSNYLRSIGIQHPEQIALSMIQELRERNFILCFLGADYYAFVHRTFLEYFCAWKFVWGFENERTISLEELITEVFGKHWQDETWHEVLRLIAGMIHPKFVGEIIDSLIKQDGEEEQFINIFLAANCLLEVRNRAVIAFTADKLLNKLKELTKYDLWYYYESDIFSDGEEEKLVKKIRTQAITAIATTWQDSADIKTFLQNRATEDERWDVRQTAVQEIAKAYKDDPQTKTFLHNLATEDKDLDVRQTAVQEIAKAYKDDPQTKTFLHNLATEDKDLDVRRTAVQEIAKAYKDDPQTKTFLHNRATKDKDSDVRRTAVQEIAKAYKDDPQTKTFLHNRATEDEDSDVRQTAVQEIAKAYKDDPQTKTCLHNRATEDKDSDVRQTAVEEIAKAYKDDPQTKTFLHNRATEDKDSDVRQTAVEEIAKAYKDDPQTKTCLHNRATEDKSPSVRQTAVQEIAKAYKDNPQTKTFLHNRATEDERWDVRQTAVEEIAKAYKDDPQTKTFLHNLATEDERWDVRQTAVEEIAKAYKDDPQTKTFLHNRATEDERWDVRQTAVEEIAKAYKDDPQTKTFLHNRATEDEIPSVRQTAVQEIAKAYKDDPQTKTFLHNLATADKSYIVRRTAVQEIAKAYKSQPELFETYYNCAFNDPFEQKNTWYTNPRRVALEIILKQFPQHPQTLPLLHDRAKNDPDKKVRDYAQKKLLET